MIRNTIILNDKSSASIAGLIIQELPPITKPAQRTETEIIDGRDGDITTPLGFAAYDKEFTIGLYGDFDINAIIAFFNSEGTVVFSNEPDKYYNYQINDQIDFERLVRFRTAKVKMHCQPFKYSATQGSQTLEPAAQNLLNIPNFTRTTNGVTITVSNGTISVSGTPTAATEFYVPTGGLNLPAGDYTLTAEAVGNGVSSASIRLIGSSPSNADSFGGNYLGLKNAQPVTISDTLSAAKTFNYLWFYITAGGEVDFNMTAEVQNNAEKTVSDEGTFLTLEDSAEAPFNKLDLKGDSSQKTYSGEQLLTKDGFATPSTDTGFWHTFSSSALSQTPLSDGWVHIEQLSAAFGNMQPRWGSVHGMAVSTQYTLIVELRNVSVAASSLDIIQTNTAQDPFASFDVVTGATASGSTCRVPFSESLTDITAVVKVLTKDVEVVRGLRFFTRDAVPVGSSFDMRVTMLAGDHSSDWQNYAGDNWQPYVGAVPAPNPDYPQDIQVVTGEQTVKVTGKNLLNYDRASGTVNGVTLTRNSDGSVTIKGTATANTYFNSSHFNLRAGTYTLGTTNVMRRARFYIRESRVTNVLMDCQSSSSGSGTTTEDLSVFCVLAIYAGNTVDLTIYPQLELGLTATDFEPYKSQTYPLSLGPLELCKIGDYQDFIWTDGESWYKHKTIEKIASYNGESIPGDYISTTGQLTTGATVYYALSTPVDEEITDATLISQLNALHGATAYRGRTHIISTSGSADNLPLIVAAEVMKISDGTITNAGNIYSKPTLTVYGSGDITISLNGIQLFQIALGNTEYITIDTAAMEAYKDSPGNLQNRLVTGDYDNFALNPGENQITFSGLVTKCVVENYSRWL